VALTNRKRPESCRELEHSSGGGPVSSGMRSDRAAQKMPHGLTFVLSEPGSLHYGKYIDERGVFRGWEPWPHCKERELRKELTRVMRLACAAGAVDTITARMVIDAARTADCAPLVRALLEVAEYFESRNSSKKGDPCP